MVKFLGDGQEGRRLRVIRGIDKRVCEESGGVYIEEGNMCIMDVSEDEKGLHIKRPDVEFINIEK